MYPVETYARCVDKAFSDLGHTVDNVYGKEFKNPEYYNAYIELDNGRAPDGGLHFGMHTEIKIPKAVWFVDSHGHPDLHKNLAPEYDHVFFAVWDKRDLFAGHKSAHWCPNATDPQFFFPVMGEPHYDFGFFGSKLGLDRADKMIEICKKRGWTYDVRQVGGGSFKHKWPRTCWAMNDCKILFNCGQRHDGPNLRVLESMAVRRPLITEVDPRNGMSQLFTDGKHYLGYEAYTFKNLEAQMLFAMEEPQKCISMASEAEKTVHEYHLIKHRVQQMIEVLNAKA